VAEALVEKAADRSQDLEEVADAGVVELEGHGELSVCQSLYVFV
jgi:hypothetical protein